jgi:hypothetical protein
MNLYCEHTLKSYVDITFMSNLSNNYQPCLYISAKMYTPKYVQ